MVNRKGELTSVPSIHGGHIKSRFLLMPALARDTMWFTTSVEVYLSARAVITFGEMTSRRRNTQKCFAISWAANGLSRKTRAKSAHRTSRMLSAKVVTSQPLFETFFSRHHRRASVLTQGLGSLGQLGGLRIA